MSNKAQAGKIVILVAQEEYSPFPPPYYSLLLCFILLWVWVGILVGFSGIFVPFKKPRMPEKFLIEPDKSTY